MAINVKHAANPSLVLQAGFGAAQAQQRADAERAGLLSKEKREARADEHDFRLDMQASEQDFRREMLEKRFGLEAGQFEFRLTAQQRADQERYQNALYEIEGDDSFSDEEKIEARRRVSAKLAGIKPLPMRKEDTGRPEGQNIGDVWPDPETGILITRQPDGTVKKVADNPNVPTFKDYNSAYELGIKLLTKPGAGPDDPEVPPSREELVEFVEDYFRRRQKFSGAGQQQGQQVLPGEAESLEKALLASGAQQQQTLPQPSQAAAPVVGPRSATGGAPGLAQADLSDLAIAGQAVKSAMDLASPNYVQKVITKGYKAWLGKKSVMSRKALNRMAARLDKAAIAYRREDSPVKRQMKWEELEQSIRGYKKLIEG